jgi:endonuclease/exonuclease/phosphatase family metal-dependent hydrolase
MQRLRIASYNVEWMNNLFEKDQPKLRTSKGKGMGRQVNSATAVAEKIAGVISDIDADIIGIEEGPAKLEQMKFFNKKFLSNSYDVFGMESGTQSIYALTKKGLDVRVKQIPPTSKLYEHLKKPVKFQPWGEYDSAKSHRMARPPVLLELSYGTELPFQLVIAHTKSQFTKGFTQSKFLAREPEAMKEAVLARQKLSADIAAYRRHVTHVILSDTAQGVVLMGDLNDGFARGIFETEFLMQSLIDQLRGGFRRQCALLEHAFNEKQLNDKESFTVEFRDPTQPKKTTRELIDHILMTPAAMTRTGWLKFKKGSAEIGHTISSTYTDNKGVLPDERPSDHVPVWADFEY